MFMYIEGRIYVAKFIRTGQIPYMETQLSEVFNADL